MAVSGISAAPSAYAMSMPNAFKQTTADFRLLAQALPFGDLAVARQAFTALQQDSPWVHRAMATSESGRLSGSNAVGSAWRSLSKALQSDDAAGAQQAFAVLQQALQSGVRDHHQPTFT